MSLDRKAFYYGERDGHFRVCDAEDLPPARKDGQMFLYLARFGAKLKVGVSSDVGARIAVHAKAASTPFAEAYLVLLDRAEAFRRETLIRTTFGERMSRHWSEWFGVEHFADAVVAMRVPDVVWFIKALLVHRKEFAREGDPRFQLVTPIWSQLAPDGPTSDEAEAA
jgi:hypothetical protein